MTGTHLRCLLTNAADLARLLSAVLSGAPPEVGSSPPANGSVCLTGGSAVASDCVVTSQQPVLEIPGSGSGNVYIVDGFSPDQNNAWVSPATFFDLTCCLNA